MIRAYAVLSYLLFLATLLYFLGWLAGAVVPRTIDEGPPGPTWSAILIDLGLMGIFAVQHSVMARPWFKRLTSSVIPPAAQRATYVLLSDAVVALLVWQWRPLTRQIWDVEVPGLQVLIRTGYAAGWLIVVLATIMIGHFELFGITQALRGSRYVESGFGTPGFYAFVRHPIMSGFILAF